MSDSGRPMRSTDELFEERIKKRKLEEEKEKAAAPPAPPAPAPAEAGSPNAPPVPDINTMTPREVALRQAIQITVTGANVTKSILESPVAQLSNRDRIDLTLRNQETILRMCAFILDECLIGAGLHPQITFQQKTDDGETKH